MKFVSKKKMKKPLLLIVLILIISISDIICDASETLSCRNVNDMCYNDEDCCSQYCLKSFRWFNGVCNEQTLEFSPDSNPIDQKGICEFHMQTDNGDIGYLNHEFGKVNAAHNSLPPYTLIRVTYDKRTIVITVNDRIPSTNGTLLDLSNEAAQKLQIKNDESVPCLIEKVIHHSTILKMILYAIPIISSIIILINLL